MNSATKIFTSLASALVLIVSFEASAHDDSDHLHLERQVAESGYAKAPVIEKLLDTTKTAAGEDIRYPEGQPRIISLMITLPAGAETGWHTHGAPIIGYIVSGQLEVTYDRDGTKDTRVFREGEVLVDALDVVHNGKAIGGNPVKIFATFASAVGATPTIKAE